MGISFKLSHRMEEGGTDKGTRDVILWSHITHRQGASFLSTTSPLYENLSTCSHKPTWQAHQQATRFDVTITCITNHWLRHHNSTQTSIYMKWRKSQKTDLSCWNWMKTGMNKLSRVMEMLWPLWRCQLHPIHTHPTAPLKLHNAVYRAISPQEKDLDKNGSMAT